MASKTVITINQPSKTYSVLIGKGLLPEVGWFARDNVSVVSQALVITDSQVAPLYLEPLIKSLEQSGFKVYYETIGIGEEFKTISTIEQLYDKALQVSIKRSDIIIALGGGIVGDITGFFAATYQRGIPLIQVPTTLLAQVDASIGGKTAVNHRHFKNMAGAFYHPIGILIDIDTLKTLPANIFACGMAEVIKYSLIEDSVLETRAPVLRKRKTPLFDKKRELPLFSMLQEGTETIIQENLDLETVIRRCFQLKAAIVELDPEERLGIREILNLGHTFGHAYETLSQGSIMHGEAVSMGLVNAFSLASSLGQIPFKAVNHVRELLKRYHLPVAPLESFNAEDILTIMYKDKKSTREESLRFVLPYEKIGKVRVEDNVSEEKVRAIL